MKEKMPLMDLNSTHTFKILVAFSGKVPVSSRDLPDTGQYRVKHPHGKVPKESAVSLKGQGMPCPGLGHQELGSEVPQPSALGETAGAQPHPFAPREAQRVCLDPRGARQGSRCPRSRERPFLSAAKFGTRRCRSSSGRWVCSEPAPSVRAAAVVLAASGVVWSGDGGAAFAVATLSEGRKQKEKEKKPPKPQTKLKLKQTKKHPTTKPSKYPKQNAPFAGSVQSRGARVASGSGPGLQVAAAGPPGTRRQRGAPGSRGSSCPSRRTRTQRWSRWRCRRGTRRGAAIGRGIRSVPRPPCPFAPPIPPPLPPPVSCRTCPYAAPHLAPRRPGSDTRRAVPWASPAPRGLRRLPPPRYPGGRLVFADRPHGPPFTLRARHVLIPDGEELHIGSERCHLLAVRASRRGAVVEDFGQKFVAVGRGGIQEPHGGRPRSWTLLDRTGGSATAPTPPRGAEAKPARSGRRHGAASVGALPHPPAAGRGPGLSASLARQPRQSGADRPGGLGSLTPETRLLLLRERPGSGSIHRPPAPQAVLGAGGDPGRASAFHSRR
ncbi:collagen alpha-2(I) chain [Chamaea fasciata]|uniref:collagen alpha-2(I) chain n=1 Tax=Chamaea fasciata TaxID=190680 RepID=UPI003369D3F2